MILFSNLLTKLKGKLLSDGTSKGIAALFTGAATSQLILFAAMPILTRLYSPADFNILATFVGILTIISVGACLRLEVAIPLPRRDEHAAILFLLSICISIFFSILVFIGIFFLRKSIDVYFGESVYPYFQWLLPFGCFSLSIFSILSHWNTRKKRFVLAAKVKVSQSVSSVVLQVIFGIINFKFFGLLIGQIAYSSMGVVGLYRRLIKEDISAFRKVNRKKYFPILKKYKKFIYLSTSESVLNIAAVQLPLIIIASITIGSEAGYLLLAMKLMQVPLSLFGSSVAQVFYANASKESSENNLGHYTSDIVLRLFKLGVGPIIFAGIASPYASAIFLGEEWRRVGEIIQWMVPWFIMQFLSSPISTVMYVTNKQNKLLKLTIFSFVLRVGTVILFTNYIPTLTTEAFAVSGFLFYLLCFIVFIKSASVSLKKLAFSFFCQLHIILFWSVLGLVVIGVGQWLK